MRGSRKQAGDTIVEVLIAVAVVGSMLASVFVLVNRTFSNAQTNKEHTQALKIAESQIERLKYLSTKDTTVFSGAPTFCIKADSSTATSCSDSFGGATYGYSISRDTTNANKFTATVNWDRIGSGGNNRVQIVYMLYGAVAP